MACMFVRTGAGPPESVPERGARVRQSETRGIRRRRGGMADMAPSEAEVLRYLETCKNWGRWGPDDELGTLNYITPDHRRAATATVREGVPVSCARSDLQAARLRCDR